MSTVEPTFQSAIKTAVASLRRVADYQLESPLADRMHALSERKEFLGPVEHDKLMALVDFSQRRTIEKLEAELALKRLAEVLPDLVARTC